MWFWEVLFKDQQDNIHSLFSLQGWPRQDEAQLNLQANETRLMQDVQNRKGTLVDVQIVYKSEKQLYSD